jgi:hypothetical protein
LLHHDTKVDGEQGDKTVMKKNVAPDKRSPEFRRLKFIRLNGGVRAVKYNDNKSGAS